jgi:transcriptional regulator with XRE-family HTH domain
MSFSENLREALDFRGIRQKELANKANLSLRNIENYLRENASIPSADKAVQIAKVLGVTVEYLVTGKSPNTIKSASIEHEIRKLINALNDLPKNKQHIVIKNAIYLTGMIKDT